MSTRRRICVVTGSRADYGVLYWVLREVADDDALRLQVVVTGMHLSPEFGLTWCQIEADGFHIDRKVETLLSSDTGSGMAKSVGLGVIGFADAFAELQPDVVVLMGDRFEIFAAAQAAMLLGIPLAHVSGGELTEGAVDDVLRHAISKMARYHFVAAEPYRQRVIQLGEAPERVFNVGDPGLDNIARLPLLRRNELAAALGFDLQPGFLLVTHHPVTAGPGDARAELKSLFEALDALPELKVVITKPNADAGGRELARMIDDYAVNRSGRVFVCTSLGQLRYLSALCHCAVIVGNSSSGIVEAPAMGRPTVNIGSRQQGRLKADSIIDCAGDSVSILAAIRTALGSAKQSAAARTNSMYGSGAASTQIVAKLKAIDVGRNLSKPFHDLIVGTP